MIKENDIILCTVKKVEGTTVFLDIEEENIMGSMILSEVAAGRIRNLGDYVTRGKKIVCKVLKVSKDQVELSLRRVTGKEREEVLDKNKKGKAFKKILSSIVKDSEDLVERIKKDYDIAEFLDEGRENPKIFEKYLGEINAKKILLMIQEKAEKEKRVKKTFMLRSLSGRGLNEIKEILQVDGEIHYQGSSVFSIAVSGKDFKEANNKIGDIVREIESRVKKRGAYFEILKEK